MLWDPNPIFITIPGIELAVAWYGVLFAAGFFGGYLIMRHLLARHLPEGFETPKVAAGRITDRILFACVIGTLVGSRIGYVLFYGLPFYLQHPLEIFNFRGGGLASHGGAIGVLLALLLFRKRFAPLRFLELLDFVVVPIALTGAFIRMGNFVNQEIVGTPTTLPWAVTFLHPADGLPVVARHPVQLYEAGGYLAIFALLYALKRVAVRPGIVTSLFFVGVFGFRFLAEFVKERTGQLLAPDSFLSMGQLLSLPFVVLGIGLLCWSMLRRRWIEAS